MSIRAVPLAALIIVGLAGSASAQFLAPGMPMPGQVPQQQLQPQQPPCFKEFAPLKAEAEKRGLAVKHATERKDKAPREEVCTLLKRYSEAEAQIVKFIKTNASSCGIPAEAGTAMQANHARTVKTVQGVCSGGGPAKPTGPGLSEALGTTRIPGTTLDPLAPQSGTFDTLTGNVLSK